MQILLFPDSSWGLTVLKNIFLRFIDLKGLKMVWEKSSLIWIFFPDFGWKIPVFPDFPDWKKSSKFSLNSLIGRNPVHMIALVLGTATWEKYMLTQWTLGYFVN